MELVAMDMKVSGFDCYNRGKKSQVKTAGPPRGGGKGGNLSGP